MSEIRHPCMQSPVSHFHGSPIHQLQFVVIVIHGYEDEGIHTGILLMNHPFWGLQYATVIPQDESLENSMKVLTALPIAMRHKSQHPVFCTWSCILTAVSWLRQTNLGLSLIIMIFGVLVLSIGNFHGWDMWDTTTEALEALACLKFVATVLAPVCNVLDLLSSNCKELGEIRHMCTPLFCNTVILLSLWDVQLFHLQGLKRFTSECRSGMTWTLFGRFRDDICLCCLLSRQWKRKFRGLSEICCLPCLLTLHPPECDPLWDLMPFCHSCSTAHVPVHCKFIFTCSHLHKELWQLRDPSEKPWSYLANRTKSRIPVNCIFFILADLCFLCRGSEGDNAGGVDRLPRTWHLVNNRHCQALGSHALQTNERCIAICSFLYRMVVKTLVKKLFAPMPIWRLQLHKWDCLMGCLSNLTL